MEEMSKIEAVNNKTILDDGVVKTEGVLNKERRRNKAISIVLACLAGGLAYWASSIGIGGFIAFIFLAIPVLVIAFIYYSKVKRASHLIDQMIGIVKNPIVPIVSFLVFGGAVITKMFFITCPRCKASVGPLYPFVGYANYCAGCGVSFDETAIPGKEKHSSGK